MKPREKPLSPNFSSGPCAKHPNFNNSLEGALGRSDRAKIAKERIQLVIDESKALLGCLKIMFVELFLSIREP